MISPFANAEASVPTQSQGGKNLLLWIGLGVILVAVGVVSGIFVTGYLNNPYRTLEPFPVAKYFDGHRAVAGAKFRGDLRVEADLGWKEGIGRLMLFSVAEDSRPIAVMVPEVAGREVYFTKGQSYLAELEVKEGGLIYANSIRKN